MSKALCIHGHFYQPPRFDPWLEDVMPEGSAAPDHDWNARITRECYAPLAWARRLDGMGRIHELVNCYAWMSFNFGPTLLRWMELHAPATYARVLEGDRLSLARLGHGNALAQVYHHVIMPLATELDKDLEVAWAVQDFQTRFGRDPEGMWLAETAVDVATLEALARAGIAFTILAPRQAEAVRVAGEKDFLPVTEDSLDTTRPYLVSLPQGKSITVFFYDGPVSRAVAFERLLANGETFWNRLSNSYGQGLRNIATDGESYGHHFMFGEMALAYVIQQAWEGRDGVSLTNYGAYLAASPARDEVRIRENTSWSCVHGVERWKTHCGCSDGGHPDWIQDWRRPLRRSLNYLKYYADEYFFKRGPGLFQDASRALREYGLPLSGREPLDTFLGRNCRSGLSAQERTDACRLLLMQRLALASFASCAWFFDDIARIEPLNALTAARRAFDLLRAAGGPDVEAGFVRTLAEAQSNMREDWDGAALWETLVTPRRPSREELGAYLRYASGDKDRQEASWPGLRLEGRAAAKGTEMRLCWSGTLEEESVTLEGRGGFAEYSRVGAEIAFRMSLANEKALLEASSSAALDLAPLLSGFTEGQHQPQATLVMQVPGLVWNWLFHGQEVRADVLGFLNGWLGANAGVRHLLERLVEERGTAMADSGQVQELAPLITRSRQLGLSIYWWELQNKVMALPDRGVHVELCQLINLSVP